LDYINARLGAWQVGDSRTGGKVEFRIFFPNISDPKVRSIRVAGDFQKQISNFLDWDFENGFLLKSSKHNEGTIWTYQTEDELDSGFYQYKYLVEFMNGETRKVSDPCTRYGGEDNQNSGFVVGGSRPTDNVVIPLVHGRQPQRDLIIYEIHLDDFTREFRKKKAPLEAVIDKLDYLSDLGINAILFMPWTAWKNPYFDWGYEPFQYFAVEYRYANNVDKPEEKISWLKKLISECHKRDIHVIMDGVFNHVSMDFPYKWLYSDIASCPYTGTFEGVFPGLQDLNFNHSCTQEFIRDVCLYWIDVFKIDGIRFDNTVNYYSKTEVKGIPELLNDIKKHLLDINEENFSLTLEHLDVSAADITNKTEATSYWDDEFYLRCFNYLQQKQIDSRILNSFNNDKYVNSNGKSATIYMSNHDHSQVAWQAGAKDNVGCMQWFKTQPYAIALLFSPGTPLIQNGQEFGENHWIPQDDEGTGRRILPRTIRWKLRNDKIGNSLFDLYKRLIEVRKKYVSLRAINFYPETWETWQTEFNDSGFGVNTEKQVVIFHRWGNDQTGVLQRFVISLNFSDIPQRVTIHFPENGPWTDLLNQNAQVDITDNRLELEIKSNWGNIFFR
jgi:pullulanase